MKLQVLQEDLSKALSSAARFTSSRAQLPVLGNLLFKTNKNKLTISSTNLETSISVSIGAKVSSEGEITIPSRTIADLVTNLSPGTVEVSSEKEKVTISTENFKSTIAGMNSADFPSIPSSSPSSSMKLPKDDFINALSKVLFAVSTDETRPILTGVLFVFKKGELSLVATDGFRLSQKRISLKGAVKSQVAILPKSALSEVSRLAKEEEEISLSLQGKDNQAVFGLSNAILATRVLNGEFPDFEKIIPKNEDFRMKADKDEFLQSVKLASVFARESANIIRLGVEKEALKVSAESSSSGNQESLVEVKVEKGTGKDLDIAFNYRFLEELLVACEGEEISMSFSGANSPGVFRDTSDETFLHLVMPVKVQG